MNIRVVHIVAVFAFILGVSLSLNLYLYFEGYYAKAPEDISSLLGKSSDIYQVNKSMFPMNLYTTDGNIIIPVRGKINVFVPQYVNCPDICHIETSIMLYAMNKSIEEGFNDKIVWVTVEVDPWHSNETIVREYMRKSAGDMLDKVKWIWILEKGDKLEKLWGQLGIKAQLDNTTGLVGHTAGFYIVDGDSRIILYYIKPKNIPGSTAWEDPLEVARGLSALLEKLASKKYTS